MYNNNITIKKRFAAIFTIAVLFVISVVGLGQNYSYADTDNSKIVIVHSNDVHCSIDKDDKNKNIGYEYVAGYRNELKGTYTNVELVDAGDILQGKPVGILTRGEGLITICNAAKYGVVAVGNHDFDYGVPRLLELQSMANFPMVSCNFIDNRTGNTVFDPYVIKTYNTSKGEKKVAYIGVTTPETPSLLASTTFKDDKGNYIYTFCQEPDGTALLASVQTAVNDARGEGADYVVVLGHLGHNARTAVWDSKYVVNNTYGIDALIDGHSHQQYSEVLKNKNNEDVVVAQVGTANVALGVLTIDVETGKLSEEIKSSGFTTSDNDVKTVVKNINDNLATILNKVVANSLVDLYALEDDKKTWSIRSQETNLGDLVADAYRVELEADISLTNAGGIRADLNKGEITNNNILSVSPFNNDTAVIRASGQQILDALEKGAMKYPDANGGFMQVSGLTYEIIKSIPSSVVLDENGSFVKVDGPYRVKNVKINGQPLDLNHKYTVAGVKFLLMQGGDGMTMFDGCEVVKSCGPKDFELLKNYINTKLGGVIGYEYANRNGQGRIIVKEKEDAKPVDTGDNNEIGLYVILLVISVLGSGVTVKTNNNKY